MTALEPLVRTSSARYLLVLFAVFFALTVTFHYPGHVTFDGITVWYEAQTRTLFSQHPPAMALLWALTEKILPSPAGFTVLQLLTLWLIPIFLSVRLRLSYLSAGLLFVMFFVSPAVFATSGTIGKDRIGAHLGLLALIFIIGEKKRPVGYVSAVAAAGLLTISVLVRYQFIVLLAPFAALFIWRSHSLSLGRVVRTATISIITAIAVFLGHVFLVDKMFVRQGTGDVAVSVRKILIFDIAGVIHATPGADIGELTNDKAEVLEIKTRIAKFYSADRVDTLWEPGALFEKLDAVSDRTILAQWLQLLWEHPVAFVVHRISAFKRLLGIGSVYDCWPAYSGISTIPADLAASVGAADIKPAISVQILRHRYFPAGTLLFRPLLYSAICIAYIILFFATRGADFGVASLCAGSLLYQATFFALPQACDVRYSYLVILCGVLGASIVLGQMLTRLIHTAIERDRTD